MVSFTYARTSRLLDEERRRLERLRSTLSEEWAAAGGARDPDILEDLDRRLGDLDLAVGRLADGTYGRCTACGRPVDRARLEAQPDIALCLEDQALIERAAG